MEILGKCMLCYDISTRSGRRLGTTGTGGCLQSSNPHFKRCKFSQCSEHESLAFQKLIVRKMQLRCSTRVCSWNDRSVMLTPAELDTASHKVVGQGGIGQWDQIRGKYLLFVHVLGLLLFVATMKDHAH